MPSAPPDRVRANEMLYAHAHAHAHAALHGPVGAYDNVVLCVRACVRACCRMAKLPPNRTRKSHRCCRRAELG